MFDFIFIPILACEPTTIAALTLVLAAAGTSASIYAQQSAADAQTDYQEDLAKARNTEFLKQAEAAREQQAQEREANARRLFGARQAGQRAEATARVAAADSGIAGASVDALLREHRTQTALFGEAIHRQNQLLNAGTQTRLEIGRMATRTGNVSINAPVAQPNYAGELLQLGQTGLGTYAQYKDSKNKTGG